MKKVFGNKSFRVLLLLGITLVVTIVTIPQSMEEKETLSRIFSPIRNVKKELVKEKTTFEYIEIVDSCGPYFDSPCVNVRSAPSRTSKAVTQLRNGVVLKVGEKVEQDGEVWYRVTFDEWFRYPERIGKDWYVSARYVKSFFDEGSLELGAGSVSSSTKYILVDRSDQKLYAYEGTSLFMEEKISTGIEITPTPRGVFKVYRKTPSRYMQGPLPGISEKYYDLPGVPWNLYFTEQGAVIHGAYWHDKFGKQWSSGCVNMSPSQAQKIYKWADLGTEVIVRD